MNKLLNTERCYCTHFSLLSSSPSFRSENTFFYLSSHPSLLAYPSYITAEEGQGQREYATSLTIGYPGMSQVRGRRRVRCRVRVRGPGHPGTFAGNPGHTSQSSGGPLWAILVPGIWSIYWAIGCWNKSHRNTTDKPHWSSEKRSSLETSTWKEDWAWNWLLYLWPICWNCICVSERCVCCYQKGLIGAINPG